MRVLIVSLHYPPIVSISSQTMADLSYKLVKAGHRVEVLTVDPSPGHPYYKSRFNETQRIPKEVNVHRIPMGPVNRLAARFEAVKRQPNGHSGSRARGCLYSLAGKLFTARWFWRKLAIPDTSADWLPSALLEARRMIRHSQYEVVISLGDPLTCHVIAYCATRKRNLRWVVLYGDGWIPGAGLESKPVRNRMIVRALEGRVVSTTDRIIVGAEDLIPRLESLGADRGKIAVARYPHLDLQLVLDPSRSAEVSVKITAVAAGGVSSTS